VAQDPPVQDLMNYEALAQDALRGVAKAALKRAASPEGLPGSHHFYITFKTDAAGVSGPNDLLSKYPDEMTIVLQNKYWDLKVTATGFEVGLTFNQVPAHLEIPFSAVTAFADPAVDFALQFQALVEDEPIREPEPPENDRPVATQAEDGSNVVTVDFGRKK